MDSSRDTGTTVRRATEADVPTLVALNRFVQLLHAGERPDRFRSVEDMPGLGTHYRTRMADDDSHFFIAEVDGIPAGYVYAVVRRRPSNPFAQALTRLYIDQISVDPSYRLRGVGAALMGVAEELARDLGIRVLALDTWGFNDGAKRFFRALGYSVTNLHHEKVLDGGISSPPGDQGQA